MSMAATWRHDGRNGEGTRPECRTASPALPRFPPGPGTQTGRRSAARIPGVRGCPVGPDAIAPARQSSRHAHGGKRGKARFLSRQPEQGRQRTPLHGCSAGSRFPPGSGGSLPDTVFSCSGGPRWTRTRKAELLNDLIGKARRAGADAADAVFAEFRSLSAHQRLGTPEAVERSEGGDLGLCG